MSRHRLLAVVQSGVLGVAALAALLWMERPLLRAAAQYLGPDWLPTARVILECAALAAAGWFAGRWERWGVLILAGIIAIPNFTHVPGIDLIWLLRLLMDCLRDSRYVGSFFNLLGLHLLLFASPYLGARFSRPRQDTMLRIQ